jgi:integrase
LSHWPGSLDLEALLELLIDRPLAITDLERVMPKRYAATVRTSAHIQNVRRQRRLFAMEKSYLAGEQSLIAGRPNAELRTREYLAPQEVAALVEAARKNRYGHRDATMILLAYRHGLRASEVSALHWEQVDLRAEHLPPA